MAPFPTRWKCAEATCLPPRRRVSAAPRRAADGKLNRRGARREGACALKARGERVGDAAAEALEAGRRRVALVGHGRHAREEGEAPRIRLRPQRGRGERGGGQGVGEVGGRRLAEVFDLVLEQDLFRVAGRPAKSATVRPPRASSRSANPSSGPSPTPVLTPTTSSASGATPSSIGTLKRPAPATCASRGPRARGAAKDARPGPRERPTSIVPASQSARETVYGPFIPSPCFPSLLDSAAPPGSSSSSSARTCPGRYPPTTLLSSACTRMRRLPGASSSFRTTAHECAV